MSVKPRIPFLPALSMALICACALVSCNKGSTKIEEGDTEAGIHKIFERGPVSVTLDIDQGEISIADHINLKIIVAANEEYEVELPAFGEKLEQFGIVDYHTSQPIMTENKRLEITRSYVLEPFLSGDYKIPTMKISFWKKGEKKSLHEIETEELSVKVRSLLPKKAANLKIHEIADPVGIPHKTGPWLWTALAVVLIGSAVGVAVLVWRKHREAETTMQERRIPAHEIAFKALEKLVSEDLTNKGEFKLFYQHLSIILRRYIENRFGLHAPERTTEEFLDDLRSNEMLNNEYRSLLWTFLGHCDLVKFAEHQPETSEIQKAFDSCKSFIIGTRETEEKGR